ncbi:MAG: hypothetical protein KatS3mg108_0801 [Isosphaeraceae bacterium]|nr:MAG: hypothetical protein KatS3mg108_0801 [Isosphaeraceae bacterium]
MIHSRRIMAVVSVAGASAVLAGITIASSVSTVRVAPVGLIGSVAAIRPVTIQTRAAEGSPWVGSGSCAASNCHGSIAPVPGWPILGNEHTTWIGDDPHARAFQVLLEPRSERIARNLAGGGQVIPAHRDPRCLACHSVPRPESFRAGTEWMDADGVGCEACHGPARDWLGPHTTEAWRLGQIARPPSFWATDDLETRVRTCAGCHIGRHDPSSGLIQDVNHDLIAAGHPRLDFEFAADHDRMPPHWTPRGIEQSEDFPARAWLIGQRVGLEEVLSLTVARASSPSAPWPEFSEYGCAGCHHDLTDRTPPIGSAGAYQWATWHAAGVEAAAAVLGNQGPVAHTLEPLTTHMNRPVPPRAQAAQTAQAAAQGLAALLQVPPRLDSSTIRHAIAELERPANPRSPNDHDRQAQRYLGLVPLYQTLERQGADPAELETLRTRLETMRERLMQTQPALP